MDKRPKNCILKDMNAVTQKEEGGRPRILFVDDSRLMRMCAQKILGPSFDLIIAESAEEAWEQLSDDSEIQAVFTDLHMPGKSGYELLRMVRNSKTPGLAEIPVVLITGAEDKEAERTHALTLGATDFITKPFQASELNARASAYADSGQSLQRLRLLEQEHHLDPETGVGNRRYCEQRLIQAMSFAARHDQTLCLMHLRLEGLNELLEDMGEPHAKRALKKIGTTLANRIRREDMVFRTDRNCFSFILPATDATGASTLQDRFLPDLEGLGLCTEDAAFQVQARFHSQQPSLNAMSDVSRIISEGLEARTSDPDPGPDPDTQLPEPGHDPAASTHPPGLEEALAMAERGEVEQLRQFLPQLQRRLKPLLALLGGTDAAPAPGGKPEEHIWRLD